MTHLDLAGRSSPLLLGILALSSCSHDHGPTSVPARVANESGPAASQAATPLLLMGELPFFLERVDDVNATTQQVTLFKAGIAHEIDKGDSLQISIRNQKVAVVTTEVVAEPMDDSGAPAVQHVRAAVARDPNLEHYDPSNRSDYPSHPQSPEGEAWLVRNAPHATLGAPFTGERTAAGKIYGDDLRYFVSFTPAPLPASTDQGRPPNENISPFAAAILRFNQPVALDSVRALDTLFFATRDVLGITAVQQYIQARGIDPATFNPAKFVTPHLVAARVFDDRGNGKVVRLQPALGFYLDDTMRQADQGVPFAQKQFRYFLHVVGGRNGIATPDGTQLDLHYDVSLQQHATLPFSLDTRSRPGGAPLFPDNRVVTVARRFADRDEDEQPSYERPSEIQSPSGQPNPNAFNLPDVFGAVVYVPSGRVRARPFSRIRQAVDNLNQVPPPPQSSSARHCPAAIGNEAQVASATAATPFATGLLNPLNPNGARLQSVWREVDMSLSRVDPFDFNLDVEQLYWGAFTGSPVLADDFDRISLFLGHAEVRPEPCLGSFSALPTMPASGLSPVFGDNYAFDRDPTGAVSKQPAPHPAFVDKMLSIRAANTVLDPTGTYKYLPLPRFEQPYFVWRDETLDVQGGNSQTGSDTNKSSASRSYQSYVSSPFLAGQGRWVTTDSSGNLQFNFGYWNNQREFLLGQPTLQETLTGGSVSAIGLPLLADFWTYPAASAQTLGINGLQISLALTSAPQPSFRVYSGGGNVSGQAITVDPNTIAWQRATGGYTPTGARTRPADNSVYWMMADFVKRTSVMTAGFVDITNPHRVPANFADVRLGPFANGGLPAGTVASFVHYSSPPPPAGTTATIEFRGAGAVDSDPWRARIDGYSTRPDAINFPLDPLKAGDAQLRKFDDRTPRQYWTGYYNKNITAYTGDPNDLMDPKFTSRFAGPNETFTPQDVRYFNWRVVLRDDRPAGSPRPLEIDSLVVAYRYQNRP